jgi:putative transposase
MTRPNRYAQGLPERAVSELAAMCSIARDFGMTRRRCYKTEVIHHHGSWRGLDDVEYATLEYIDCFNQPRLQGEIGMIPPADFDAIYQHQRARALTAVFQYPEPL